MIRMKIWADVVCPYCYIGITNLMAAIEQLQLTDIDIQFASYLKYPFTAVTAAQSLPLFISDKYGISEEEALIYIEEVAVLAGKHGQRMHVQQLKPVNTFTMHRLWKLAAKHNLQQPFYRVMSEAYFLKGANLEDTHQVMALCEELALPKEDVSRVMSNSALFESDVEADLFEAKRLNIQGVPYFLINNNMEIVGVQTVQWFEEMIKKMQ